MKNSLSLGMDIGSTTAKLAVTRDGEVIYSRYERHFSKVRATMTNMLRDAAAIIGTETFTAALKERFPALSAKGKVCDAVYRRQQAVEAAAQDADLIIIAGSPHSSNARRMCEIARRMGKESLLIDTVSELPDISGFDRIALSAGASTPDPAVQEILARLTELGWKLLS